MRLTMRRDLPVVDQCAEQSVPPGFSPQDRRQDVECRLVGMVRRHRRPDEPRVRVAHAVGQADANGIGQGGTSGLIGQRPRCRGRSGPKYFAIQRLAWAGSKSPARHRNALLGA